MELSGQGINEARRDGSQVFGCISPKPDRAAKTSVTSGSNSKIRYRECLRNHAANVGGNVFDGCGEFMPGGEEGTIEALKCAACDCHRNFHRKEVDGEFSASSRRCVVPSLQLPAPLTSPTVLHHHHHQKYIHANPIQSMNVGFGGGVGGGNESSSEDINLFHSNVEGMAAPPPYMLSKKRFRTKFSQEQKERMIEFAEKIEWRMSKQVEEEVDRFCAESGVKRQVFKVWMHNNKNNHVKNKQTQEPLDQEDMKDNI
ncbi:zinc-finger homeodomain protein 5 [Tripterygium wilfordii]|uniref:Zinc-finger homeodomain protein 5 n=1 Tax=Tripterygium wilfordii TaxID=458696 RepID=A0A7J7D359_TRIWF|nr:zinc-finger homeodomain protein 5 [Tripterygium wilfordii]KAF5740777.1 zinc-finger homeodomain protein 5 [Tripterygium wilfordii]